MENKYQLEPELELQRNSDEEGLMEDTEQLEPGLLGIQKTSSEGGAMVNMYQLELELEIQRNSSEGVMENTEQLEPGILENQNNSSEGVMEDAERLEPEFLIEIQNNSEGICSADAPTSTPDPQASCTGDKLEQPCGRYGFFY
jgi:hypothetical protein